MKLVTYRHEGRARLGAMLGDAEVLDLERATGGRLPSDMISFLEGGDEAFSEAREALAKAPRNAVLTLGGDVRLDAPVLRPGKVLAIGLNYRDHAEESGQAIPQKPVVFSKASTCITGPGMPVHLPRVSSALDWEAELCFVIGRRGRHIPSGQAMDYVAGYCCGNDLSVRDWQFHSPTWMIGKGFDTHGPIGPWLVTKDDVPDVNNLRIGLTVNGEQKQSSNTSNLIFGVEAIVEYVSSAFTLEPGDVIFTGTPAGVGGTRRPPEFLKSGDVVRVEIDGLGVLENKVVPEPEGFVLARGA